jgi:quercetin dioxygenase-like cupin family protein
MTTELPTDDIALLHRLRDVHEAIDALYRFAAGQDQRDEALFRSAFAPDATLDFTQPAERHGATVPVMTGRDAIATILDVLRPLVTSHTVTNPRVTVDGDRATLSALVSAQHVSRDDPHRHLLLENTYDVDLARDGDRFVVESMTIRNLWSDGDPSVLFATGTADTAAAPAAVPVRGSEATWIDQGDGVELAPLRVVGGLAGTALLRFAAGARSPAHRHPGGEDLYVVSGRLRVGDVVLDAGDYLHTAPGGVHDAEAEAPTLVVITVPEPIEVLEAS